MPDNDGPIYRLTLRALRDEVPGIIRLRRLLKIALRALRLRCINIDGGELGKPVEPDPQTNAEKHEPPF